MPSAPNSLRIKADLSSLTQSEFTALVAVSLCLILSFISYDFVYQTLSFGFFGFPL